MRRETIALTFVFILVVLPLACLVPSLLFGGILAVVEGWKWMTGVRYIGGGLVLISLIDGAPITTYGRILDAILACLSLGIFGWVLALVGALPMVEKVKDNVSVKKFSSEGANAMITLKIFVFLIMPVLFFILSFILAGPMSVAEGWGYMETVLYVAGIFAHCPSISTAEPTSAFGYMITLIVATYALMIAIGVVVGIFTLLPAMDKAVDLVSSRFPDSFMGQLACFLCVVVLGVPVMMFPLAAAMGSVLTACEGWDFMTGVLFMGGHFVLMDLTSAVPITQAGMVLDYICSCFGIGMFGFFIAFVGALPFADTCADRLNMKKEKTRHAVISSIVFFLFVMPLMSLTVSSVLGGFLAVAEEWSYSNGFLLVLSIMVQSPGLAPASAVSSTAGGQLVVFFVACMGICISIGLGAGIIVSSHGLDRAANYVSYLILRYEKEEHEAWMFRRRQKKQINSGDASQEMTSSEVQSSSKMEIDLSAEKHDQEQVSGQV